MTQPAYGPVPAAAIPLPAQPPEPPPYSYAAPEAGPADELLRQLEAAKAAREEAEAVVRSLTASIEAAVAADIQRALPAGAPLPPVITIAGTAIRPGYTMRWVTPVLLDTKRIRKERPDIFAYYSKPGTDHWELRKAGA